MSRAEHTYTAGDVSVVLTVPDGIEVPREIRLKRSSDGAVGTFKHGGVRNLRAPRKQPADRPVVRASKVPDDFTVTDEMRAWAAEKVPSVGLELVTAEFLAHWQGSGKCMADWVATWRTWVLKQHRWNVEKGWKPSHVAKPKTRVDTPDAARARWLSDHGLTEDEFEANRGTPGWLETIQRRGKVA